MFIEKPYNTFFFVFMEEGFPEGKNSFFGKSLKFVLKYTFQCQKKFFNMYFAIKLLFSAFEKIQQVFLRETLIFNFSQSQIVNKMEGKTELGDESILYTVSK